MVSSLLSLPFELRLQIWNLVLGPTEVEPCKCSSPPRACKFNHPGGCCEGFDVYKCFDNRILRVNRQIYDEVHPMVLGSPKIFTLCNGLCLESMFLGIQEQDRRWVRRVRVQMVVGNLHLENLRGQIGSALLQMGESRSGPYVQSALQCPDVGSLIDAAPAGQIEEDGTGRRTLWVDLVLS